MIRFTRSATSTHVSFALSYVIVAKNRKNKKRKLFSFDVPTTHSPDYRSCAQFQAQGTERGKGRLPVPFQDIPGRL